VGDLALALQQSSLAASRAGLSVTETTAALAAFADAGLKGSDAGTSLKTFLLGLVPSTIKARDAMKELGISFVDANGNIKPLAEIADILQAKVGDLTQAEQQLALKTMFGTDAYRAASVVMEEGRKGIEKYTAATSKQGNAADVAEGKMKGLPGVMEELSGSIETAVLQIGEEQLGEMMTDIAEGIQDALKAFKNLSPEMRANIVKWAAYGVALGPAAKLLGGITYSLGGIVKLGGAAARALGKVAAVETATTVAAGGKVAAGQGTLFKSAAPVAAGSAGAAATTGLGGPVAWAAIATAATIYANKKALDELGVSLTELGAIGKGIELLPGFGTLFRNTRLWQQLDEAKEGTRELGTAQEMVAVGLFDTVRAAEAYRNVSDGAIQATKKQRGQLAGLVGALDDLGRPLDATTQSMVNNLLKVGDWRGAFKLLQGELDTAGGKIEKHRRGIDDAAGAAADHEQKVRGMSSALQDVPERVSPRVELRGLDPVLAGLRSFQNALDGIDGFLATATVNVRTVGGGGYDNQRVLHSGGKAGTGAVRYGRQRRPDEFPSILQRGERVVTDHAFRELTRGRGALSGPLSISGRLMIPGIGEAILEGATIVVDRALNNDDDITRSRQALFDN
jgi:hypothetical protein